jgi:hypothetical protein
MFSVKIQQYDCIGWFYIPKSKEFAQNSVTVRRRALSHKHTRTHKRDTQHSVMQLPSCLATAMWHRKHVTYITKCRVK